MATLALEDASKVSQAAPINLLLTFTLKFPNVFAACLRQSHTFTTVIGLLQDHRVALHPQPLHPRDTVDLADMQYSQRSYSMLGSGFGSDCEHRLFYDSGAVGAAIKLLWRSTSKHLATGNGTAVLILRVGLAMESNRGY